MVCTGIGVSDKQVMWPGIHAQPKHDLIHASSGHKELYPLSQILLKERLRLPSVKNIFAFSNFFSIHSLVSTDRKKRFWCLHLSHSLCSMPESEVLSINSVILSWEWYILLCYFGAVILFFNKCCTQVLSGDLWTICSVMILYFEWHGETQHCILNSNCL